MGLLSSSAAVTRYLVNGKLEDPVLETIRNGLEKRTIMEAGSEAQEKNVGWTSLERPYLPDLSGSSFVVGPHIVFSLRIDKKTLPSKVVKMQCTIDMEKRKAETGRDFLSKEEKKQIREHVELVLYSRIPATPNVYDILWNVEENMLWLFSTQGAVKEELEALFFESFGVSLIPLFPFTEAELTCGLGESDLDRLSTVSPALFVE
ncbi:Putative exonuclease, RdgC [Desulfatibacillum alkenivorans DSM 16219]|jgi:recombination associated protein RdgC|uniref:Putative exonuclease, RdgC n=1 Tax=Desulfatibacillum alkenivorans DSM 16219 TaxID=1121393 RepID=A0A1M6FDB8_9BACT|nr:recombination-associated protein RdgC [Desulfatibacillum alkenivorans]SHI95667.1 Putative exonuclease, RdgC [Desulfatibacillum alkenivorans DSM 16219]